MKYTLNDKVNLKTISFKNGLNLVVPVSHIRRYGESMASHSATKLSAIEEIFMSAFYTVKWCLGDAQPDIWNVSLEPQFKIGSYRVDFVAKNSCEGLSVIVECDSQQFHDRTEKERRYEKQRDRFLQEKGYRIFHFTGSEIFQMPYECARQVICAILKEQN